MSKKRKHITKTKSIASKTDVPLMSRGLEPAEPIEFVGEIPPIGEETKGLIGVTYPVIRPQPLTLEEYLENNPEKAKADLLTELKQLEDNYQIYLPEDERKIVFGYIDGKSGQDLVDGFRYCTGFIRATRFGFYPKELKNLLEEDQQDNLLFSFVLGVIEFTWGQYDISLDYLNRVIYTALNNRTKIPRKVVLTAMQLAILNPRAPEEYNKMAEMADLFLENIKSIEALRKICEEKLIPDFNDLYGGFDEIDILDSFIILPDIEFKETEIEQSETLVKSSISLNTMVDLLKAYERDQKELIDHATEKIIHSIDLSKQELAKELLIEPPETINERLLNECPWVEKLANQSALVNAEFLFNALNRRSWGEVVTGYCNTAEAEIRNKIIKPFNKYLWDKYKSNRLLLTSQAFSIEVADDMSLKDVQTVFSRGINNPKVMGFLNLFDNKSKDIISKELPGIIENLRKYRNETPSTHGSIVTSARDIRQFVLGTPDKPGILKKLAELPKVA